MRFPKKPPLFILAILAIFTILMLTLLAACGGSEGNAGDTVGVVLRSNTEDGTGSASSEAAIYLTDSESLNVINVDIREDSQGNLVCAMSVNGGSVKSGSSDDGSTPIDGLEISPMDEVRFLLVNELLEDEIEFIVGTDAEIELRKNMASDAVQASLQNKSLPFKKVSEFWAHDGHAEEEGPNANEDFRYRALIKPDSRNSLGITFPEIGEFDPPTGFICGKAGNTDLYIREFTLVGY